MGLNEKVAVVFLCLRVDSNLELSGVVTVSFVKVRPGQIGGSLHLALAHVLHSCGQKISIAFVVLHNITEYYRILQNITEYYRILQSIVCHHHLADRPIGKDILSQLELVHRDPADLRGSLPLEGEGPAGVRGPDIKFVQHFQFPGSQETISGALDLATLPLEGLSSVVAVPRVDVAQAADVRLTSEHPQFPVSPAGPVPLQ